MDFRSGTFIKIKTDLGAGGSVPKEMRFYANTNLISIATNAPYEAVWQVEALPPFGSGTWNLTAVAVNEGQADAVSPSVPITVFTGGPPPVPVLVLEAPANNVMVPVGANVKLEAELLASLGDAGPVEFLVGTNSVARAGSYERFTVENSLFSYTLTNVSEGQFGISARYLGANGLYCACNEATNAIRVVTLGIAEPKLLSENRLSMKIVTAFPGRQTLVQASGDLRKWGSISTNVPGTNYVEFSDVIPQGATNRWYRAVIP